MIVEGGFLLIGIAFVVGAFAWDHHIRAKDKSRNSPEWVVHAAILGFSCIVAAIIFSILDLTVFR